MSLNDEILKLIEIGENSTVDFKEKLFLNDPSKVAKTLSSFANYKGGKVLLGVTDEGIIAGETIGNKEIEKIMMISSNNCKPPILPEIEIVHFEEGDVGYINVPKSRIPIKANDRWYIRHGNTTRTMEFEEIKNYADFKISSISDEIDIESILATENDKRIIYEDGRAVPYVESKIDKSAASCVIYANIFNTYYKKAYFLQETFPRITIDELRTIIEKYYSIFQIEHHISAFGISQGEYNWFGYGPLNFLEALENQNHRYAKIKKCENYIHHREASCFIDELNDTIFYIHAQPNHKINSDEKLTIDYLNVGFLFNKIPYDNIYREFFEGIGVTPQFVGEIHHDLSSEKSFQQEVKGDDYVIESLDFDGANWVCGIIANNLNNSRLTAIYTNKFIVNFRDYHPLGEKQRYKIFSVGSTEIPDSGFQALVVNYKGNW